MIPNNLMSNPISTGCCLRRLPCSYLLFALGQLLYGTLGMRSQDHSYLSQGSNEYCSAVECCLCDNLTLLDRSSLQC